MQRLADLIRERQPCVALTGVEARKGAVEARIVRRHGLEQRQARAELEVVRAPEDLVRGLIRHRQHQVDALAQPHPQHRVAPVRRRLGEARETELVRHLASSQAAQLWEDEPHPVAALAPGGELRQDRVVDQVLRPDEAVEVVG